VIQSKKGMLFITPKFMPEVKKSMQEKGISAKIAIENKVDVLQALIVENELNMEMKKKLASTN
jgi:hypothetical protein